MAEYKKEVSKDEDILAKVKKWVQSVSGAVSTWESNQEKWHKLRMRIKKAKSSPFPDCSNIRMPTGEIALRKVKAQEMNMTYGIRPVVQVIPTPSGTWEAAKNIEKFLDHLIMDILKMPKKSAIIIDQKIERGFFLAKPYWRLDIVHRLEESSLDDISLEEALYIYDVNRTEEEVIQALIQKFDVDMSEMVAKKNRDELKRAVKEIWDGKSEIELKVEDVIYNYPDVALIAPERCYVPTASGYDPQSADYLVHEFFKSVDEVKSNVEKKNWNAEAVEKIESGKYVDLNKSIDYSKDNREGIQRVQNTESQVKIWEVYGRFDLLGDGVKRECVVTVAPEFDAILRKVALPFYSGRKPFVKFFYELREDRWFGHRGLIEMIEDIIKEIDVQHMQKIDSQTLRNTPNFLYRAGMLNKNPVQFGFGQGYAVHGLQDLNQVIKPFERTNTNAEYSYEREQMILEGKVSELIGITDFNLQSMVNKRQPRTKGEVEFQEVNKRVLFSLDGMLAQEQHSELFEWIWELWCQYGPDEYEFNYFGNSVQGQTIKLTKEQYQGKYIVKVRGNDNNTNPEIKLQKAQAIVQGISNPVALQSGVVTPMNIANAYKRYFQELDIVGWEEFVTFPQPQPPSAPEKAWPRFKDLTDAEKAQVLEDIGISPDVRQRILDKQREIESGEADDVSKLYKHLVPKGGQANVG